MLSRWFDRSVYTDQRFQIEIEGIYLLQTSGPQLRSSQFTYTELSLSLLHSYGLKLDSPRVDPAQLLNEDETETERHQPRNNPGRVVLQFC